MQLKNRSRTINPPALLLVGMILLSFNCLVQSSEITDNCNNNTFQLSYPSRKLLVSINQVPSQFSNEITNWLKTSDGMSAFDFCNQLTNKKCSLNNLNACNDIMKGCITDYWVTKDKEIAKNGVFFAEDFKSKSKASSSKKYCTASGDPHFINYDGQFFDLQEPGIYTLVKFDNFEVQEKMMKHTGGKYRGITPSCMTGFSVKYNKLVFEFDVNNLKKFVLNGKLLDLPPNKLQVYGGVDIYYGSQKFEWKNIKEKVLSLKLTFPNGFSVGLFGSYCGTLEINCPEKMFGKVTGICGNSDGSNDKLDFKNKEGDMMNVNFGNKNWKFSGNDGPNSPMSKWQLAWKAYDYDCLFLKNCETKLLISSSENTRVSGMKLNSVTTKPAPAKPTTTLAKPASAKQVSAPAKPTPAPAKPVSAPAKPTPAPAKQVSAPAKPTPAPAKPTPAPAKPTPAPAKPVSAPAKPTPAPAKPVSAPAKPTPAPAKPVSAPAKPTPAPAKPTSAPAKPTPAPAKPVSTPTKPVSVPAKPVSAPAKPVSVPAKPVSAPSKPAVEQITVPIISSSSVNSKKLHANITKVVEFHNQTSLRIEVLKNRVEQIISNIINENFKLKEEQTMNLVSSNKTMNVANDNYQKSLGQLNKLKHEIDNLNKTMNKHYNQMIWDSKYLEKLEMIKPQFLNTLTSVNSKLGDVENMINVHITPSDDKNQMISLIKDMKNTTHYSTNDLATQFLEHYQKYKKFINSESSQYSSDKLTLDQLLNKYNDVNKYSKELYQEYKKIYVIVQKLKDSIFITSEETEMFNQLVKSIMNVLTRKTCINPKYVQYTGKNKECATELLGSHISNGLVR